jgi:hypothetical protein
VRAVRAFGTVPAFYEDTDNDGYGDINSTIVASAAPNGYVRNNTDCNDNDAAINPGAIEVLANGIDDDCDGQVDEIDVGDLRYGGVVFWIDPADNAHGLVCALQDYPNTVEWGCNTTDLPSVPNVGGNPVGPGAEIGDGELNTTGILADCSSAPAALAARSYGSEWFLPSINELYEMHVNKALLEAVSGFAFSNHYWSSTENDNDTAWEQKFGNGTQDDSSKYVTYNVRAVRAF